jgi:hypothetical protein
VFAGWVPWILVALIALNLIVYAPVRHCDFVQLDDPTYVTENPNVSGGVTWSAVAWAFTTGHAANWHPLTWLSHMLDVRMYGVNAGPHHVTSVLLHIANTLLLFGLLLRMTGAPGRSAFVAALFAVHPLHVESVAWVAERKDVLSTLFWMLTLLAYTAYVRHPRWPRYVAVLVLFALGLMAKPMVVTLPFVLLLLDVWPLDRLPHAAGGGKSFEVRRPKSRVDARGRTPATRGRTWLRAWVPLLREKIPLFALAAASSVVTFVVQQRGGAVSDLQGFAFGLRLENALVSYVAYLRDMLWPSALTVFYGFPDAIPAAQVALAVLVLAAISFVVFRLARRCPYLPVGWLWYLGTLVPVAGIVQVGLQARADRYTYVPLIGIFIMVAWGMPDLLARWRTVRRAVPLIAALVVVACAVATRAQVAYWKDDVALWTHATMVTMNTDEYHAHMSLGAILGNQGRLDEAVRHFSAAVRLQAGSVEAQSNLGLALAKQGKLREAIGPFAEAVRLAPDQEVTHLNLGFALSKAGRVDEAVRELSEVLRIDPGNQAARRALEDLRK